MYFMPEEFESDRISHHGEELVGVDPTNLHETYWREELRNIAPLLASKVYKVVLESRRRDDEPLLEHAELPVEHEVDENGHRKAKIIVTVAAAATLTGLGYALIKRGRFVPKLPQD